MKQVILLRKDLKMPLGKSCSQAAHASVEAVLKSPGIKVKMWKKEGMKKAVLSVSSEQELLSHIKNAKSDKLTTSVIKDAGKTFFKEPTITCGAIGPDTDVKIDKITSKLKLIG